MDVSECAPILFLAEHGKGVEHPDQNLGLLPELLFMTDGRRIRRSVGVDAAMFVIDADADAVIRDFAHQVRVGPPRDVEDVAA